MESLSAECTPLKYRYDSCFNSWFEGYLQPALDADPGRAVSPPSAHPAEASRPQISAAPSPAQAGPSKEPRQRIITNWSAAFPGQTAVPTEPAPAASHTYQSPVHQAYTTDDHVIDTTGKSRNQIKAEEYELKCGSAWREYKACLQNAIGRNPSLSTLLEQAREDHPLRSQAGLKGTVWDADYVPEA